MAAFAKMTTLELSSDEEEAHEAAPLVVPREIRTARRSAALALTVSALMCLVSAAVFVTKSEEAPASPMPPSSLVGLNQEATASSVADGVDGSLTLAKELGIGLKPTPYHLVAQSHIRNEASVDGTIVQEMPAGSQVFPVRQEGDWMQVVVARHEIQGQHVEAAYGWLPVKQDDNELLVADTKLLSTRRASLTRSPSTEERAARWADVRAKNANLTAAVLSVQSALKKSLSAPGKAERKEGSQGVKAQVGELIKFDSLKETVGNLREDIPKGLKSTNNFFNEIGKLTK